MFKLRCKYILPALWLVNHNPVPLGKARCQLRRNHKDAHCYIETGYTWTWRYHDSGMLAGAETLYP